MPIIDIEKIMDDGKFKKSTLIEMKTHKKKLYLNPLLMDYINSISRIQNKIRNFIERDFASWRIKIDEAVILYKKSTTYKDKLVGLAVVCKFEDGTIPDFQYLLLEPLEYNDLLTKKNKKLDHLKDWIITSDNIEM